MSACSREDRRTGPRKRGIARECKGGPRHAPGTRAAGRILAKGTGTRIVGIRIEPGTDDTARTLRLGGHLCATSGHVTVDRRTAVVVRPSTGNGTKDAGIRDEGEVVIVDPNTDKKLWSARTPSAREALRRAEPGPGYRPGLLRQTRTRRR
ncbi:hypothetical protein [Streptomyces sp. NPDC048282]|uniref:hypothetical protein n=1 Tax=Streptomyces sp. NPDC048282 TaxID=3365528 RepID=UPI0037218126